MCTSPASSTSLPLPLVGHPVRARSADREGLPTVVLETTEAEGLAQIVAAAHEVVDGGVVEGVRVGHARAAIPPVGDVEDAGAELLTQSGLLGHVFVGRADGEILVEPDVELAHCERVAELVPGRGRRRVVQLRLPEPLQRVVGVGRVVELEEIHRAGVGLIAVVVLRRADGDVDPSRALVHVPDRDREAKAGVAGSGQIGGQVRHVAEPRAVGDDAVGAREVEVDAAHVGLIRRIGRRSADHDVVATLAIDLTRRESVAELASRRRRTAHGVRVHLLDAVGGQAAVAAEEEVEHAGVVVLTDGAGREVGIAVVVEVANGEGPTEVGIVLVEDLHVVVDDLQVGGELESGRASGVDPDRAPVGAAEGVELRDTHGEVVVAILVEVARGEGSTEARRLGAQIAHADRAGALSGDAARGARADDDHAVGAAVLMSPLASSGAAVARSS